MEQREKNAFSQLMHSHYPLVLPPEIQQGNSIASSTFSDVPFRDREETMLRDAFINIESLGDKELVRDNASAVKGTVTLPVKRRLTFETFVMQEVLSENSPEDVPQNASRPTSEAFISHQNANIPSSIGLEANASPTQLESAGVLPSQNESEGTQGMKRKKYTPKVLKAIKSATQKFMATKGRAKPRSAPRKTAKAGRTAETKPSLDPVSMWSLWLPHDAATCHCVPCLQTRASAEREKRATSNDDSAALCSTDTALPMAVPDLPPDPCLLPLNLTFSALSASEPLQTAAEPTSKLTAASQGISMPSDVLSGQFITDPASETPGTCVQANPGVGPWPLTPLIMAAESASAGPSSPTLALVPYVSAGQLSLTSVKNLKPPRAKVHFDLPGEEEWGSKIPVGLLGWDKLPEGGEEEHLLKARQHLSTKIESFLMRMHHIQGDRTFLPWKGSVVDSVVGAFLTQNVADNLSSSAFMSIRSFSKQWRSAMTERQKTSPVPSAEAAMAPAQQWTATSSLLTPSIQPGNQTPNLNEQSEPEPIMDASPSLTHSVPSATPTAAAESKEQNLLSKVQSLSGIERARNEISEGGMKKRMFSRNGEIKAEHRDWLEVRRKAMEAAEAAEAREWGLPAVPPDSVDWEAIRDASVDDVAQSIRERGMHFMLAGRIKAFLDMLHDSFGLIDLEWLHHCPADVAQNFLVGIRGMGLKSTECIRLLCLQHSAFPVDTNVGRICVRLGWVPLEPLPEQVQLHLLEQYPLQASIQRYLWPRLCQLDQRTLYELHYQMITFGKVFCTKVKPNCAACPMQDSCQHYAGVTARNKAALGAPSPEGTPAQAMTSVALPWREGDLPKGSQPLFLAPQIEFLPSESIGPGSEIHGVDLESVQTSAWLDPIIEEPQSPAWHYFTAASEDDMEAPPMADFLLFNEPEALSDDGPLGSPHQDCNGDIVCLPANIGQHPKLRHAVRLRTVHYVYEIPDDSVLLSEMPARAHDDPCPYLLLLWLPGDCVDSIPAVGEDGCSTVGSCPSDGLHDHSIVLGTVLIGCRTAMEGSFPLNGTYFQTNEVFVDFETCQTPMKVPRKLLWNLNRRFVYFGTSMTAIARGMDMGQIQALFWSGYTCMRAFCRKSLAPKPLPQSLHAPLVRKNKNVRKI